METKRVKIFPAPSKNSLQNADKVAEGEAVLIIIKNLHMLWNQNKSGYIYIAYQLKGKQS